jgi:diguanylate cyclase (GGDEF)-like protein/PAS domain S-box-containing protein
MEKKTPIAASKVDIKPKKKQLPKAKAGRYQRRGKSKSSGNLEAAFRQYTDLYDFAPVGYFTLTRNGVVHQVNLAGAKLLGMNSDEATQLRLVAFISSDSQFDFKVFFEELLSGEGKKISELKMHKKGGGGFWAQLEASCFEGGDVCRVMMTDITDRKHMEKALQESEKRFRMLLQDVSSIAVQGYGMDGTTQYWNTASERLYGYSAQEAIGRNLLELIIPPEMRDEVGQAIHQMAETGQTIPAAELSLMNKDGSRVAVYSCHAVVSVPGRGTELFCLDIDLSERKRTEELLKESEWRNRIVSELTTDYIFVADVIPGGVLKLRWVSDNMFRITGRKIEDAATSDMWGSIIHPDDRDGFFSFINKVLSVSDAGEFECRTFYKKGAERWIRIFARQLVGDENTVTTIVGAIEDITEPKLAERALRESEELFSLFIHHSPIHAYIKEVTPSESRILQASDAFLEMVGMTGREMIGKTMQELFPADFASKITADDWDVVASGRVRTLDESLNGRYYTTIKFPIIQGDKILLAGYTIDITERQRAEMELQLTKESLRAANMELQAALLRHQELAHTDALTGIHNRRHLFELGEREFNIAMRYRHPLSVIMFDIDHFKKVNDTFGHAVGDQMLQLVTRVACAELRSTDVIGRYGGEEFVIILPMTNAQQAYPLAERIRLEVQAVRVTTIKGEASVTLSIGIVEVFDGMQVESIEKLINAADEVMYTAKQAGRNRTKVG